VLALNSDDSVRRLGKGNDRPVNQLADRAAVAAALECVNLVTWFAEDTPLELIRLVKPDVLVKGGDWKADEIVGAADVRGWGGTVHAIPIVHDRSTTALLDKIKKT
jgi:D-glycero-beta-D-manno-heptose 1-phosphate adenylyltransferase